MSPFLFSKRPKTVIGLLLFLSFTSISAQNPQANSYKGIWFTLGQFSQYGAKYSGGLGTYTSSRVPIAIYAPKVNKPILVYGGSTGRAERHLQMMLSCFDHKTGLVPKPVIVYDKEGVDGPHDHASLSIDEKGCLWGFISARNTTRPGIIFKSKAPYQIKSCEPIKRGGMTYPQTWWMKDQGFLYLFTKYTNGRELYWSTSRDGKIWQPEQKLSGMRGHYQVPNVWNNKVVSVFNDPPGGDVNKRTNIYLVQTTNRGQTWTPIDG